MKKHLKKLLPLILLLVSFIIVLPFLTSCSGNIPGVNGSEIVNLLFPQPIVFAAQILATIILFFVVSKFVWKPYTTMINKRKEYVMSEVNAIEEKKHDLYEQEKQLNDAYLKAQLETSQMIQDAKNQSDLIISEAKIEAKNNYDLTIQNASNEVDKLKIKLKSDMRAENVELVLMAAEELTMKNINSTDNKRFVEDFLNKIDKELS